MIGLVVVGEPIVVCSSIDAALATRQRFRGRVPVVVAADPQSVVIPLRVLYPFADVRVLEAEWLTCPPGRHGT